MAYEMVYKTEDRAVKRGLIRVMAEGKSAIPTYNYLIVSHFLSFSDFTPHFTPHNFLSIMAFKAHGSFISGVTDAIWQSDLGLVRGGWGLWLDGLRLSDRGSTMGWHDESSVVEIQSNTNFGSYW